ncbi:hypothetical protein HZS61_010482 [Fusarium oxysporum f. sp. conglutinans]|uniref:Nephrocystin 3-like N-terminal domain-containing protein n=1 Tax=Fusarium oxysporum f. sp. conglutinans TaxID=100902 RepID=A0A8H6GZR3_FUSOX|nr:hypothetical protein HZS61_010482 [Fusarium oxysporum f. sp. conglutinans]KAG6980574.1 Vegetative incompatibility protein HET-E-1 [Fusarium oxysporum f. sp. conglutinans]
MLEGHQLGAHVDKVLEQRPRLRQKYSRPPPDSDRLYRPDVVHPDSSDGCGDVCSDDPTCLVYRKGRGEQEDDPAIHYGLVASANQLMKDALARDKLAASMDVLCFEMEAAGLMNHFPCLVIRGICDYSDSHKNKEWQGFAAMMAAAYAKDLLREIPPSKVEAEKPISEILSSIESAGNETKYAVMSMASDHHSAKIERWLSPPDYSTNANLARERRHPGTRTWLLNSPAFQEWKLGSRQHLWLHGLAGCGKTILSTTILDHLLQTDTHTTLAFFFDFNDARKQKLEDLLRSLAVQLYHTGNEAAGRLDSLFISHDDGRRQPDTKALSACVNAMIQNAGTVFIIIDALDECTTREELLQWLKHVASRKAQLIVTGRPEVEFQSAIPQSFNKRNCIQLDKNVVNGDIRSYVEETLEQKPDFVDKKLSPDILEEIRNKIGSGADGMFRWAACQLEGLARCLSPAAIEIALMCLPHDLNETYCRMLENIPSEYKNSAIHLLQFLVHTKRPLTLPEAVEVIAPTTYKDVDRTPSVPRRRTRRTAAVEVSDRILRRDDRREPSDDESAPGPPDTPTPSAPTARLGSRRSQRIALRLRSSGRESGQGQGRQYCTQQCLLRLKTGGYLDLDCPNAVLHKATAGGKGCPNGRIRHPISYQKWFEHLRKQLVYSLDDGIVPLGMGGARGVLFQVTLLKYGYTFVSKGTVRAFIPDLQHEAAVYER